MNVVGWRMRKSELLSQLFHVFISFMALPYLHSSLEGSVIQVSEQGLRKNLYQKIVAQFPDGWMSSGHISREGEHIA
jgi:hypothetical protein